MSDPIAAIEARLAAAGVGAKLCAETYDYARSDVFADLRTLIDRVRAAEAERDAARAAACARDTPDDRVSPPGAQEPRVTGRERLSALASAVAERDAARADVAWWEDRHGHTRAEATFDDEHEREWEALSKLSDEEVRAELVAMGIDPDGSRERVFYGVTTRMAGSHAALRKVTAERDEWREEARAAKGLFALTAALADPLACGHPLACLPDHPPADAASVRCAWCAEVATLRALLAECRPAVAADAYGLPVDLLDRVDAALDNPHTGERT